MTNHTNPATTNTRQRGETLHHFGLTDAKGREHGLAVATWVADLDGVPRYFLALQKTRDSVAFGGEAKHEHFATASERDTQADRLTEKLHRQREREATGTTARGRWAQVITETFAASSPAPQNLPKLGAILEQGAKDAADIAASFGPSGELELKPLTEEGARAILDAGVSDEQLAAELADKGNRHHARSVVGKQMYAQELADNAQAAKKSKRPAAVKRAARLERIRQRLEK